MWCNQRRPTLNPRDTVVAERHVLLWQRSVAPHYVTFPQAGISVAGVLHGAGDGRRNSSGSMNRYGHRHGPSRSSTANAYDESVEGLYVDRLRI
jgi:hypothetical protein